MSTDTFNANPSRPGAAPSITTADGDAHANAAAPFASEPREDVKDVTGAVECLAGRSKEAARALAKLTREKKDAALQAIASALEANAQEILAANARDLERAEHSGLSKALVQRLSLDAGKVTGLASALRDVAALDDPVGQLTGGQTLPNGLRMRQERVPLGVVAAIYEARPNVTVDIAGLALKSGNAAILRGGSAAEHSNKVLVRIIQDALDGAGLPRDAVQSVDAYGRAGAQALMRARGLVDVLIPRGGHSLIQSVIADSTVPVIETGEGNVHIFLDASADPESAPEILLNAKTQKPSVCNTVETLLIHRDAGQAGAAVLRALAGAGVRLHADVDAANLVPELAGTESLVPATEEDWAREYLDLDLAVKTVADLDQALEHIRRYTTGHTEAILTADLKNAERFVNELDSAALIVNASTRFTDGSQMGLGAEIGISTQKLHARGPMGLAALTTTKWIITGDGHTRA